MKRIHGYTWPGAWASNDLRWMFWHAPHTNGGRWANPRNSIKGADKWRKIGWVILPYPVPYPDALKCPRFAQDMDWLQKTTVVGNLVYPTRKAAAEALQSEIFMLPSPADIRCEDCCQACRDSAGKEKAGQWKSRP